MHRLLHIALVPPTGHRPRAVRMAVDAYLALAVPSHHAVFALRVGLVLRRLAVALEPAAAGSVTDRLLSLIDHGDAHHARDVLGDELAGHLPADVRCRLETARAAGLDHSVAEDEVRDRLLAALRNVTP